MKKILILFLLLICVILAGNNLTSIRPGIKDIILGKTYKEINELLTKNYQIQIGSDNVSIFSSELTIESFIQKYSPLIMNLREIHEWDYNKFKNFAEKEPYKNFIEPASREIWLTTEYPLKFKRWKKFRFMLTNFNPFVRRVDLAFYKDILYYARFYIKDKYKFNDTYLAENEERFLMHLYVKYKKDYGNPVLFNNYEYQWRDNNVELALDGKNSTLTFKDYKTSKLVVRYLKNVSIILSKMQIDIQKQHDYVEHNLRDF